LAEWQAALRAVTYVNTSENPETAARMVTFLVSDGTLDSNLLTSTIEVTAVNDVPALSTNLLIIGGGQAVVLTSANFNATDPDNAPEDIVYTISDIFGGQFEFVA